MKLLVLGGTQFVGRHLVESALVRGHDVTLFNRGKTNPGLFPQAEQLVGDRTGDLSALETGLWDAVVDVNGYLPRHVRASAELLHARAGAYCFVSTIAVYAEPVAVGSDETAPVKESVEVAGEELTMHNYGECKVRCERAVEAAFANALVLRPGMIVGPHAVGDGLTHWVRAFAAAGDTAVVCAGRPEQPLQLVDARDLAAFALDQLERGGHGTYNVVGPAEPTTLADVLDVCRRATRSAAEVRWEPGDPQPLVQPGDGAQDAIFTLSCDRAVAAGLRHRPLVDTARDVLHAPA